MTPPLKVHLPTALTAFVQAQANSTDERCGLLLGQMLDGVPCIDEARAAPNISKSPSSSFEIDPATRLITQREARAQGRAVLGLYHTHPKGAVEASARDHAGAREEPGLIWLIATQNDMAIYLADETGLIDSLGAPR